MTVSRASTPNRVTFSTVVPQTEDAPPASATLLPGGDYASPGLKLVLPDDAFPNKIVGNTASTQWRYLRREITHNWYVDRRNPTVGFLSRDEALILYNLALGFQGLPCLEIGCWRGWSTVHIALGAGNLEVIDPVLSNPDFRQDVLDSLRRGGVLDRVVLHAGLSPEEVERISVGSGQRWSFIFIDGDHDGPAPRMDAEVVHRYASDDAMIVLHDLASPDVAAALYWLREHGWETYLYQTMQIMGVAVRGSAKPVDHVPDPSQRWSLPLHLTSFPVIGETRAERLHRVAAAAEGRYPEALHRGSSRSSLDSLPREDTVALDFLLAHPPSDQRREDLLRSFDELQSRYLGLQQRFSELESTHESINAEIAEARRGAAAAVAARQDAQLQLAGLSDLFDKLKEKHLNLLLREPKAGDQPQTVIWSEATNHASIQHVEEARNKAAVAIAAQEAAERKLARLSELFDQLQSRHLGLAQRVTKAEAAHGVAVRQAEDMRREAEAAAATARRDSEQNLAVRVARLEEMRCLLIEIERVLELRHAIHALAFCLAHKRVLFGLLRRLLGGRRREVRRIFEQMLGEHGIPHDLVPSAMWLTRPRMILGLARRRALSDALSVHGHVALVLEQSLGLLPSSAMATWPSASVSTLRLMQSRLTEVQGWLAHDSGRIPDTAELQHLRGTITELQERIATAQQRYVALEEAKLVDEKALFEADLIIARLRGPVSAARQSDIAGGIG